MLDLRARRSAHRADDRDAAGHFQRARRSESAGAGQRGARALRRGALWPVRLHGFAAASRRSTRPMTHPASDFAREVMQVALAGTGIRLADGPLEHPSRLPPHRAAKDGARAHRAPDRGKSRDRSSRPGSCTSKTSAAPCERFLPGLGPASCAAPGALRRRLFVLPRKSRFVRRAPAQFHRKGRAGHAHRPRLRRCRHGRRAC